MNGADPGRNTSLRVHEPGSRQHLCLVGPTASGKSGLALELARRLPDVELVSVDSMQVYRGMDIGTAKPTAAERAEIPHHLLDLADPTEDFSVARFQAAAEAAIADIERRGHRALLVGGTGLYLQAVVDGLRLPGRWPDVRAELEKEAEREPAAVGALHQRLADADPAAAARIEPGNTRRIVRALEVTLGSGQPFSSFGPGLDAYPTSTRFRLAGVWLPRAVLDRRIEDRYGAQLAAGFLDEVRALPPRLSRTAAQALGYRELLAHLAGATATLDEALAEAVRRTRQFARRQQSWFRRDPRITWLGTSQNPVDLLPALLGDWSRP
ncbi:MAG: tRNA dimethylallyltransferase [Actinomycetota bacterium]|jgi:tRNA dimethylallyltransferase|nr:tRNA dimethylallyltransferase [Actinomycetota bacterium]